MLVTILSSEVLHHPYHRGCVLLNGSDLTDYVEKGDFQPDIDQEVRIIDMTSYPVKDVLDILLQDKTTGKNIIWATDAYKIFGYSDKSQISPSIFKSNRYLLQPRINKSAEDQQERTRKKAEVFTPVWLCNKMNNYCDEQWFGRKDVFNHEKDDNTWEATKDSIQFPEGKDWKEYVDSRRLEITCGEAPYLVSRYDAATGEFILPPLRRIGILDRKLRVVNENTSNEEDWKTWAIRSFQSSYGYEWQGDSLLIARVNCLMTFFDYYKERWSKDPDTDLLRQIANIISWNLWQMDGFNDAIPLSSGEQFYHQMTLFDTFGSDNTVQYHQSYFCRVYDWRSKKSVQFKSFKTRGKMDKKLFDYIIGNPPYQVETSEDKQNSTNGQASRKNVFQILQIAANNMAKESIVLIYPGGRWIQRSGKGMQEFGLKQINDSRLSAIYYYPNSKELFSGVSIDDGVSIVVKKQKKLTPGFKYVYCQNGEEIVIDMECPGESIIPLDPKDVSVASKIDDLIRSYSLSVMHNRILPRSLFGIESDFAHNNSSLISEYIDDVSIDFDKQIKLFTNDKAGPSGRATWFVVDKSVIKDNVEYIGKWKVVVSSAHPAGAYKRSRQLEIVDNHSAFGRSRVALAAFDTESEALNYVKYIKSYVIRYAFLLTDEALSTLGVRVPDIKDYTNDNKLIDFSKDVDAQLTNLMSITVSEFEYIKNVVSQKGGDD